MDLLQELIGKTMWTCRRAADMSTFQFGQRFQTKDFVGRPSDVGEYALHIQCAWRIVRDGAVVVGSSDLYYPADYSTEDVVPPTFNWDHDPNRRDRLLTSLFEGHGFELRKVTLGTAGFCRMEFDGDLQLEIFPTNSVGEEQWRLFATLDVSREPLVV